LYLLNWGIKYLNEFLGGKEILKGVKNGVGGGVCENIYPCALIIYIY